VLLPAVLLVRMFLLEPDSKSKPSLPFLLAVLLFRVLLKLALRRKPSLLLPLAVFPVRVLLELDRKWRRLGSSAMPYSQFFTMQFSTVAFVMPLRTMPSPVPVLVWVMECPAQFRVMLFAPMTMPLPPEQFIFPVSVVLVVIVAPHSSGA